MRIIINMRDLWDLSVTEEAVVDGIGGDLPETSLSRLAALGFRKGQKVQCLGKTPLGGPRVFQIGDSVFSLARDLAAAISIDKAAFGS